MRKPGNTIPLYAGVFALLLSTTLAFAQKRIPAGGIVWNYVGRVYINPANGTAQVAGYFTNFEGLGSLFAGPPSEATAYFTYRSDLLQLQPLPPQPDFNITLAAAGKWHIYFNPVPAGNWNDLESFSHGQIVATLTHSTKELIAAGPNGTSMFSGDLLSSADFVLNGAKLNLHEIFPNGITNFSTISSTPVSGTSDFPIALPYAGSAIAKGPEPPTDSGSNEHR
jgi:hypothetical protein